MAEAYSFCHLLFFVEKNFLISQMFAKFGHKEKNL